jgi:hypothetical protein
MTWFPAIGGRLSKLNFGLLARRGHQRGHCNEEGFGTLSRQLGNDERLPQFPGGCQMQKLPAGEQFANRPGVQPARHAGSARESG